MLKSRNRWATATLSPVLIHFLVPHGKLSQKFHLLLAEDEQAQPSRVLETQHRLGPKEISYDLPTHEWPTILQRVLENHESYRKVANDYGVSHQTIQRLVHATECG